MIARLTGKLVAKQPPLLVLDVSGVGYEIEAPMSTFYRLPPLGETVMLLTHMVIREDAHLLYGFAEASEKALFRALIKVSGIGPKLALALLSGISVEEFWSAVRANEAVRLTRIPGVGKKTAERLIIELRDKSGVSGQGSDPAVVLASGPATPLAEARNALGALGYKPAEIDKLVSQVETDGRTTEQIIQDALRRAVR